MGIGARELLQLQRAEDRGEVANRTRRRTKNIINIHKISISQSELELQQAQVYPLRRIITNMIINIIEEEQEELEQRMITVEEVVPVVITAIQITPDIRALSRYSLSPWLLFPLRPRA